MFSPCLSLSLVSSGLFYSMSARSLSKVALAALLLFIGMPLCHAGEGGRLGFSINVEADSIFNPVVTKIVVTGVKPGLLAATAGIVDGDEIIQIEGHPVVGSHAKELQPLMKFGAGETRTLRLKHAGGKEYEAKLTKPKE